MELVTGHAVTDYVQEHMLTLQVSQDVTTASAEVAMDMLTQLTEGLLNQS